MSYVVTKESQTILTTMQVVHIVLSSEHVRHTPMLQGSWYYPPKECIVRKEMPQHYHRFVLLFDSPNIGPIQWPLRKTPLEIQQLRPGSCLSSRFWTVRKAWSTAIGEISTRLEVVKTFLLVGGWTNPLEKYARQISSFPQGSGWKQKTSLSCHHRFVYVWKNCSVFSFPWLV